MKRKKLKSVGRQLGRFNIVLECKQHTEKSNPSKKKERKETREREPSHTLCFLNIFYEFTTRKKEEKKQQKMVLDRPDVVSVR